MEINNQALGNYKVAWVIGSRLDSGKVNEFRLGLDTDDQTIARRAFFSMDAAFEWLDVSGTFQVDGSKNY